MREERGGRAPGSWRTAGAILRKDLLLELRGLDTVPAMVLLAIVTFVIFHFGLNQATIEGQEAAGVLTVTLLFAAMLGINRLFVAEREQGGFDAFLLAPVDRSALMIAKATALFLFLVVLEVIAVPAFALLLLGPPLGPSLLGLIAVLALGDVALAVIGTLVSAIAVQTRARDLIGPIIGLPLLLPALIGMARGAGPLLAAHGSGAPAGRWVAILALYDVVFALLSYAVFDFLLED
jgi:heme exporter protein B